MAMLIDETPWTDASAGVAGPFFLFLLDRIFRVRVGVTLQWLRTSKLSSFDEAPLFLGRT
jgi:hypothetical protein